MSYRDTCVWIKLMLFGRIWMLNKLPSHGLIHVMHASFVVSELITEKTSWSWMWSSKETCTEAASPHQSHHHHYQLTSNVLSKRNSSSYRIRGEFDVWPKNFYLNQQFCTAHENDSLPLLRSFITYRCHGWVPTSPAGCECGWLGLSWPGSDWCWSRLLHAV